MRAQILSEHGGPEKLVLGDVPIPRPEPGQVLVRVVAAAVNPVDIKIREGLPIGPDLPAILGADLAGRVEEIGEGVSGLEIGDEVYGCAGGVKGFGGTLAEFIATDAELLAPKPTNLSFREAAALPLVSITAWQALERLGLTTGESVLIFGGAGGVGHVAVQLAKASGARVAAVVGSTASARVAVELGADEIVNYKAEPVDSYVQRITDGRGFEAVLDTVGGANLAHSLAAAAIGGRIATTNARTTLDLSPMHSKALSLHLVFVLLPMLRGTGREAHGKILRSVTTLAEQGKLKPLIDATAFNLATSADAHRLLASGAARGKVVIDIA